MLLFARSQWGVFTGPTFLPLPHLVEFPPQRLSLNLMSCQPWISVQPEAVATGDCSQSAIKENVNKNMTGFTFPSNGFSVLHFKSSYWWFCIFYLIYFTSLMIFCGISQLLGISFYIFQAAVGFHLLSIFLQRLKTQKRHQNKRSLMR